MNFHPEFSKLVENYLAKNDRTLSWLARRLHVSPSTVTRWLNYETRPGNVKIVIRIADILNIDKDQLLIAAGYGYIDSTSSEEVNLEEVGYYPEFSNFIAQTLMKRERTLFWLAKHLGIGSVIVSRWLNTETRPGNPELVVQIADILQIDKFKLLIAAGYGYQEKIEQEPSISKLPTFESQSELEAYLQVLTQSFGEKLFEYSKQRGYSQLELAQHLDVSPAAVSQWRTGRRIPNAKALYKIMQALGTITQEEMDQFLQAWAYSKLANDLSDYLATASDDPMSTKALEKLLHNL